VNGRPHEGWQHNHEDQLATLVRSLPVRLVEVSRGGCRLECASRLESGTSGLLAVELAGLLRIDDIRVARCQPREGAGPMFQVGAELLRTRRLGRRSIRMGLRKIISGDNGVAHARRDDEGPLPEDVRTGEANGRTDGRAPPGTSDRGS
jgi:hypothetical protein